MTNPIRSGQSHMGVGDSAEEFHVDPCSRAREVSRVVLWSSAKYYHNYIFAGWESLQGWEHIAQFNMRLFRLLSVLLNLFLGLGFCRPTCNLLLLLALIEMLEAH